MLDIHSPLLGGFWGWRTRHQACLQYLWTSWLSPPLLSEVFHLYRMFQDQGSHSKTDRKWCRACLQNCMFLKMLLPELDALSCLQNCMFLKMLLPEMDALSFIFSLTAATLSLKR